ncbi:acyl carrier protein [Candidatus Accumulibacter vicinus]|uniref:D-alanine--poly(Phosphoribitol) ligase subunit 2 n=1 Tax=Candidatus Accumulibacter vicinus TaxID=2954382 RepID=A0A084Y0J1_9PROT|nr:acyl carrier protein [Candidatus Accumulibacter vicinus]KFB68235.1 MAG: D-alanine--poly(phosphoribitol) ligase subunit 2 [Candidatus Accumulibacter vicinus]
MNTEELKQAIKNYIIQEFLPGENPDNVTDDLPLISSGILDSIATLKLVLFIEERFGITLEAHETDKENMDTLAQMVATIEAKQK